MSNILRGSIWLVDMGQTEGAEMQKIRPAVVVSPDEVGVLPLHVVVPLTDWRDNFAQSEWLIEIDPNSENQLDKPSAADTLQVRSMSESRFIKRLGEVSADKLSAISHGLKCVLGFKKSPSA